MHCTFPVAAMMSGKTNKNVFEKCEELFYPNMVTFTVSVQVTILYTFASFPTACLKSLGRWTLAMGLGIE
jgi:hypothetical protein